MCIRDRQITEKGEMMINFLNKLFSVENQKTSKGDYIMGRQALSKTTKIRNLFNTGADVTWKSLRNKFDLKSPAAMVGKLRNEGLMIYENRSSNGVSYRVGTPSKAILIAGMNKVFGKQVAYSA